MHRTVIGKLKNILYAAFFIYAFCCAHSCCAQPKDISWNKLPHTSYPSPAFITYDINGRTWNSSSIWGKSSAAMLIIGSQSSPQINEKRIVDMVSCFGKKVEQKRAVVLIFATAKLCRSLTSKIPECSKRWKVCLLDESVSHFFSARMTDITAAVIDKPGFAKRFGCIQCEGDIDNGLQKLLQTENIIEVGSMLPDFCVLDSEGNWIKSSDWAICRNVVLTFASDIHSCSCSNQILSFQGVERDFSSLNTSIIAITPNSSIGFQNQRDFIKTYSLSLTMIPDETLQISTLFGAVDKLNVRPRSILIDKNGKVRWIWTDINFSTHAHDVLNKIKDLKMFH